MTDNQMSVRAALGSRYEILDEVGRGGMATVYRAHDRRLGRTVALKVLHPELTYLLGTERFHREITIAAALQHPSIVALYEAGEEGGFVYFTMPLIEGETLRARLKREGQLPVDAAVRIAGQVAEALGAAHAHGVVHRDVKPENILLVDDRAMVADFGLARAISAAGEDRLTSAGLAVGTPEYMSPEQASSAATLDTRTDIYSLGCVLYEMLEGEPPFTGPSAQAVIARHLQEPPHSLRVVRPTVPRALEAVVERALAKVPVDRYATARDFSVALERSLRTPAAGALARGLWRRRWVVAAVLIGLVGLALAGRLAIGRNAFAEGKKAFDRWNMPLAQQRLRRAVLADPGNGEAHLWLAEAGLLQGADVAGWRPSARAAVAFARRLPSARDSALARALLALADGSYPQACAWYDSILARDTLQVLAWFGLGECRRRDDAVVRDPGSPTGWRFRSSYQSAVDAYGRALDLAPYLNFAFGPSAYERLVKLVVAEPYEARNGVAVPPDTGYFLAYPALDHDTLLLLPHRAAQLETEPPSSSGAAMAKGRKLLRDLVTRWVDAFPGSGRARAALARDLELRGELADSSGGRRSAFAEIREARRLEAGTLLALEDVLTEVRLDLKLLRFGAARALAESVLAANPAPDTAAAAPLACLAALLGRAHLTARLLAETASDSSFATPTEQAREAPLRATEAALRLMAYASLGAPAESLPAIAAQVDTTLWRYAEPERVEGLKHQLQDYSAMLAFPVRGTMPAVQPAGVNFLTETEWLLAQGDREAARARLARARRDMAGLRPGGLFPEHAFLQGWLSTAVGDTAAAEWLLGLLLDNLSAATTMLIGEPKQAAMLVRAMALEARLAARRGDRAGTRLWAARVDTLWSGSDLPQLKSIVAGLDGP